MQKLSAIENGEEDSDAPDDEGEWAGIVEPETAERIPSDEEYVDEDKYTTVTVEPMDDASDAAEDEEAEAARAKAARIASGNGAVVKKKREKDQKPKKKKFRYETKAERQMGRAKQKSKNHKAKLKREGG